MSELFASGQIIDLILALVAAEALAGLAYHRLSGGKGPEPVSLMANLAAGACLLLALRAMLAGSGWVTPALCLSGALAAHVIDIGARWRR